MFFKRKTPRIKLVHLLSRPEDDREQGSIASLRPLEELGVQYIQHVNPPYKGEFPVHDSLPPKHRKPRVFGCFSAHKKAFLEEFSDVDLLLICECDCVLRISHKRFLDAVVRFGGIMDSKKIVCMSIGGLGHGKNEPAEGIYVSEIVTGTQCMLFSKKRRRFMRKMFHTMPWCAYDIWLSRVLGHGMGGRKNSLAVSEVRLTTQLPGHSLVKNDHQGKIKVRSGIGEIEKGS